MVGCFTCYSRTHTSMCARLVAEWRPRVPKVSKVHLSTRSTRCYDTITILFIVVSHLLSVAGVFDRIFLHVFLLITGPVLVVVVGLWLSRLRRVERVCPLRSCLPDICGCAASAVHASLKA